MGLTERVARFIVETPYEALPRQVLQRSKDAILDTIGVALAGSRDPAGQLICEHLRQMKGRPEAGVLAAGFSTTAVDAALANGTMAHALDFDDINMSLHGHPSVPVLPAVLALAEKTGASGREALAAYTLGFEVECKMGLAVGVKHYERGWHATSTAGMFGAAAAAARLLRLSVEQTRHALGIVASHVGGLRQNFGTMTKPLHAGLAASAGVRAGLLAQAGFTADQGVLENRFGFLNVVGEEDRNPTALDRLGSPWDILEPGVYLKPYAACGSTHRSLDALFLLRQRQSFSADEVEEVRCVVPYRVPMILIHDNPRTALEGKFSLQYCLAASLLDGQVGVSEFTDEMVQRPEARRLFPRVKMVVDTEGPGDPRREFADVTVSLSGGRTLHARAESTGPNSRPPMSRPEIEAKFREGAGLALEPADVDRLRQALDRMEELPDLRGAIAIACRLAVPVS